MRVGEWQIGYEATLILPVAEGLEYNKTPWLKKQHRGFPAVTHLVTVVCERPSGEAACSHSGLVSMNIALCDLIANEEGFSRGRCSGVSCSYGLVNGEWLSCSVFQSIISSLV